MMYKPSDFYYMEFTTQRFDTGVATNADSLPVATANHNGTDDTAFTLTVVNKDTGRYLISGRVPVGYAAGDVVCVSIAATLNAIAGKGVVDTFQIDTARTSEVSGNLLASTVETNLTVQQALQYLSAREFGAADPTAKTYSAANNPTTVRIAYGIDANGKRTVTLS